MVGRTLAETTLAALFSSPLLRRPTWMNLLAPAFKPLYL